jgi:hypothetical protein
VGVAQALIDSGAAASSAPFDSGRRVRWRISFRRSGDTARHLRGIDHTLDRAPTRGRLINESPAQQRGPHCRPVGRFLCPEDHAGEGNKSRASSRTSALGRGQPGGCRRVLAPDWANTGAARRPVVGGRPDRRGSSSRHGVQYYRRGGNREAIDRRVRSAHEELQARSMRATVRRSPHRCRPAAPNNRSTLLTIDE